MTIEELRVFLQDWFCGCGSPEAAADTLRDLLALHPLYENRAAFEALIPSEGLQYLVLYTLHDQGLTEHGGSVGGGWLTEKGAAVLAALREFGGEQATVQACIHGHAIEAVDACRQCAESWEKPNKNATLPSAGDTQ